MYQATDARDLGGGRADLSAAENPRPRTTTTCGPISVLIENRGNEIVQLISRHWHITDAQGPFIEVRGPGVVQKQPMLKPGESFDYTSGTPLATPYGVMGGEYQMTTAAGETFDVEIPTFSLESPFARSVIN